MSKKSKINLKGIKERWETRKTRIEVIGALVAIIVAVVALIETFYPFKHSPEAKLEIVDFYINDKGPYPKLTIKLRNTGGSVAFLKKADLLFEEIKIEEDKVDAAAEVNPVLYSWLITDKDVKEKNSSISLSRKIDANDTDNIEFVIGYEKLKTKLNASVSLRVQYNSGQTIVTPPSKIIIYNSSGVFPMFMLSENPEEITKQLQEVETPYTIRQIIENLTDRKYEPAAPIIQRYLHNPDPDVRVAAVAYFSGVKYKEAIPDIVSEIYCDNPKFREWARKAIILSGDDSIDELNNLISDNDPSVREFGVEILGEINTLKCETLLLKEIKDRGVAKIVFNEEILVSASAIRALAKIKSKEAREKIGDLLNDNNVSVKIAAIDAAKELDIKYAIPSLVRLLNDKENRVREDAHDALIQLTGKDYGGSSKVWREILPK